MPVQHYALNQRTYGSSGASRRGSSIWSYTRYSRRRRGGGTRNRLYRSRASSSGASSSTPAPPSPPTSTAWYSSVASSVFDFSTGPLRPVAQPTGPVSRRLSPTVVAAEGAEPMLAQCITFEISRGGAETWHAFVGSLGTRLASRLARQRSRCYEALDREKIRTRYDNMSRMETEQDVTRRCPTQPVRSVSLPT